MTVLLVKRFDPTPLPTPQPGDSPIFEWFTLAHIQSGDITSEVQRVCYWDEKDREPLEVAYEVKIDGLPETGGMADIVAYDPELLLALSQVATTAAAILREYL